MIDFPAPLKAVGGARTGIAPVNLLDVQDVNGNFYYWADRAIKTEAALSFPAPAVPALGIGALVGAFADSSGKLVEPIAIGNGPATFTVPFGATRLQLGIDDDMYGSTTPNQGSFQVQVQVDGNVAVTVTVPGTAMPWDTALNPSFPYSLNDGTAPVIAVYNLLPGQVVTVTYLSGTVNVFNDGTSNYDANGKPTEVTNGNLSPSGTWWPTKYMTAAASGPQLYSPWLLSAPAFTFNRSLQTDVGNVVLQNLSGDTLSRDFEKQVRRSALEGALFVYRLWQTDAQAAWIEMHGTLTVEDVGVDTATLKGVSLINPAQDDTPLEEFCETCQWTWALARCGSTQQTECQYSFQTCQVVERFGAILNNYEKNYGDAQANLPLQVINRTRKV